MKEEELSKLTDLEFIANVITYVHPWVRPSLRLELERRFQSNLRAGFEIAERMAEVAESDGWQRVAPFIDWDPARGELARKLVKRGSREFDDLFRAITATFTETKRRAFVQAVIRQHTTHEKLLELAKEFEVDVDKLLERAP